MAGINIGTATTASALDDADRFAMWDSTTALWRPITGATLRSQLANRTTSISNIAASGAIGAASVVDDYDIAILGQTTATILLSNPTPADTGQYRRYRWYNGGTVPVWNAYGQFIQVGGFADQMYIPGTGWKGIGTKFPQTVALSGTPVAYPSDTNANSITLLTVPGGFPAAGSSFDILLGIDNSSGTSSKTVTCSFGSFNLYTAGSLLASATGMVGIAKTLILPTTSSQVSLANIAGNFSSAAGGLSLAGTQNTASNTAINATVTKGTAGDTTTLRYYRVTYTHGA